MEKYFRISKKNRKSNKRLIANQAATDKYKPRATQALIFETIEWRSLGVLILAIPSPHPATRNTDNGARYITKALRLKVELSGT